MHPKGSAATAPYSDFSKVKGSAFKCNIKVPSKKNNTTFKKLKRPTYFSIHVEVLVPYHWL
jgi:hypothetical protein